MANPVSSVDVPLSIFGSWNTELSPPDIPEGGSPANNDVVYSPGSVSTRPGLNRLFSMPLSALGPFTYEKSFVTPSGTIKNLYMSRGDSNLYVEDVTNAPGVVTLLFDATGATYASSCTAQGREYIALSDGVHGFDVPLQYDGTNLYRVTQDGPGAPPTVTSFALPTVTMATFGSHTDTITSITSSNPIVHLGGGIVYYQSISITLAAPDTSLLMGQYFTVSGNTNGNFNTTFWIAQINPTFNVLTCNFFSSTLQIGTGGSAAFSSGTTLVRAGNTVSGATATAHGLRQGYQVQIQGAGSTTVATISTIVLNNEDTPGIATVTTAAAHGLLPNNQVTIVGVSGATVGTAISNVAFADTSVTITTSAAHGLSIGSIVTVAAVTATAVNGQWVVATIPSTTTFTYAFAGVVTAPTGTNVIQGYSAADTGSVTYIWPLASVANGSPAFNYFTVQTAPSPTTFTIALAYTDGTWTGGTVSFGWDGIFYVTAVPSTTTFQYQQYGPNASTTTVGTVTPYGQASPGLHQCRVSGILPNGSITVPSPPVTFVANGGQYLSVSNLPIGPNWVGRLIQFTGAGGAYFFDIPVPAQINGLVVSTATQINDNVQTSVTLDFSDNTLYAASADSIPGNDLAAQLVLGPCAGFFTYASRLLAWGDSNKVQNFVNMGFDGGYLPSYPTLPSGWGFAYGATAVSGMLIPARLNTSAWQITSAGPDAWGAIAQGAYEDTFGAPIILPNQTYLARFWASVNNPVYSGGANLQIILLSSATSYETTAAIPASSLTNAGGWVEVAFSLETPNTIPSDLQLIVQMVGTTMDSVVVAIDELEIIYAQQPYIDYEAKMSYADNLTAFDANTCIIGATDDLSPIRNFGTIRQALYVVTGTGLHETQDNEQTEPSGWTVAAVADNCGAFSIASVGRNAQGIGSAGKDWMMWSGPDGAQIFTGQKPYKVSQELQSVWDAIPSAYQYQCWTKNYESSKRCYFGIPTAGPSMTVLVLDYRNIDGAAIAENPPIHISFTGKMIVSDLTRKWTSWTIPAYSGELLYRAGNAQPQIVFGAANNNGNPQSYVLNPLSLHDDDFGVIPASYTTYFFVSHEMEQALQVGSHRHVYTLAAAYISGTGTWSITPLAASLSNPFPESAQYPLYSDPGFDIDFGINVETSRCAFTVQAAPISPSLDSYFKLQKLIVNMAKAPWASVRGSATGRF